MTLAADLFSNPDHSQNAAAIELHALIENLPIVSMKRWFRGCCARHALAAGLAE